MPVHSGEILSGGIMSGNIIFNIFTSWSDKRTFFRVKRSEKGTAPVMAKINFNL